MRRFPNTPGRLVALLAAGLAAGAFGCTGLIGDRGPDSGAGDEEDADILGDLLIEPTNCDQPNVGPSALRHMTRVEYNNTVRDLLGDATQPAKAFPADDHQGPFVVGLTISPLLVDNYVESAAKLAEAAVGNLGALLACDTSTVGEDTCAQNFIQRFGRRAYRRPLGGQESEQLFAFYKDMKATYGFDLSIQSLVERFLLSPSFLDHIELGVAAASMPEPVQLAGPELASRLSYFLWNTMPDEELLKAAESGALMTPEGVEGEARRLLKHPNARAIVQDFEAQWLGLDRLDRIGKDPNLFPQYDSQLRASMRAESMRFIEYVVFEGDGLFKTLFTGTFSFVDERLAALYGTAPVTGTTLQRRDLDPKQRAGFLTQASVMSMLAKSNQTSPVHRGQFVRDRLMCEPVAPPPPEVMAKIADPDPTSTTRERFAQHSANGACSVCHQLMDPIGFGFENYDAVGQFRTRDGSFAVDASGEILEGGDLTGTFDGAVELAHKLADSRQVQACFAANFVQFALHRSSRADACSRFGSFKVFESSGLDIRELIVAITRSDSFRYIRSPSVQEVP